MASFYDRGDHFQPMFGYNIYWSDRMKVFLQAEDPWLWQVVITGPRNERENSLDDKAKEWILSTLNAEVIARLPQFNYAKELWEFLITEEQTENGMESLLDALSDLHLKMKENLDSLCSGNKKSVEILDDWSDKLNELSISLSEDKNSSTISSECVIDHLTIDNSKSYMPYEVLSGNMFPYTNIIQYEHSLNFHDYIWRNNFSYLMTKDPIEKGYLLLSCRKKEQRGLFARKRTHSQPYYKYDQQKKEHLGSFKRAYSRSYHKYGLRYTMFIIIFLNSTYSIYICVFDLIVEWDVNGHVESEKRTYFFRALVLIVHDIVSWKTRWLTRWNSLKPKPSRFPRPTSIPHLILQKTYGFLSFFSQKPYHSLHSSQNINQMAPKRCGPSKQVISSSFRIKSGLEEPTRINNIIHRGGSQKERVIAPCYFVDFFEVDNLKIVENLKELGLENFLSFNENIHVEAVKWFYKHVKFEFGRENIVGKKAAVITLVCGEKEYMYEPHDFLEDFNLSEEGFDDFDINEWPSKEIECDNIEALTLRMNTCNESRQKRNTPWAKNLNGDRRCLLKIIRGCILHTTRQDQNISTLEAVLIEMILLKKKINLPYLLICHMHTALKRTSLGTLPLGILITHIMEKWKIGYMKTSEKISAGVIRIKNFKDHMMIGEGTSMQVEDDEPLIKETEQEEPSREWNTGELFEQFIRTRENTEEVHNVPREAGSVARALSFTTNEQLGFEHFKQTAEEANLEAETSEVGKRDATPIIEGSLHISDYINFQSPRVLPTPTPGNITLEQRIKNVEQEVKLIRQESFLRYQQVERFIEIEFTKMKQTTEMGMQQQNQNTNFGLQQINREFMDRQVITDQKIEKLGKRIIDFMKLWGSSVGVPLEFFGGPKDPDIHSRSNMPGSSHPAP